ncbi:hypothetical protein ATK74_0765 [Propionicimonas paludicola]|uniref:Uncharacterized protein n=1 Tax=Propionicimonas paludicola TaxID=185243 RepID=A0A2A9CPB0_9ACTN|nr:hypothetical protein [Propionicimonas paludicola]PFG16233.1 hypothetical protein ATK74_0765 [Propionicimonas paludicola]
MVGPQTCELLAQIVPVFLLVFAVRGSLTSQMVARMASTQPRRPAGLNWRDNWKLDWAVLVVIFLLFEFALVLGAASILPCLT